MRREGDLAAFSKGFEPRSPELASHSPEGMRYEEQRMPNSLLFAALELGCA
jgi:hypothetical protein